MSKFKFKAPKISIGAKTSQAIKAIKDLEVSDYKPKTRLGKAMKHSKDFKLAKQKIKAFESLGKSQTVKAIEGTGSVIRDIVAGKTASELANRNSYNNGLAAWQKNFSGNPDKETGADGSTQSQSTSELGG